MRLKGVGQVGEGGGPNLAPSSNAVPSQAVIRELDGLKRNPMLGYQAREAVGVLERAQEGGAGHSRSGSGSRSRPPLLRLQGEDEVGSQGGLLRMRSAEGRGGDGGIGRQKEVGSQGGLLRMRSAEGDVAIITPSQEEAAQLIRRAVYSAHFPLIMHPCTHSSSLPPAAQSGRQEEAAQLIRRAAHGFGFHGSGHMEREARRQAKQ